MIPSLSEHPSGPPCFACGARPGSKAAPSETVTLCKRCAFADVPVSFCDSKCYERAKERHEKQNCVGQTNRRIFLDEPESWKHFCTPGCRVEIVSPRLRLRPVEIEDDKRIFAVKNERLVSSQQLYGVIDDPSIVLPFFTAGYLANNIPALESEGSPVAGRTRYVWAIEPRLNKDGTRMVEAKTVEGVKHDLDANGYIGNIAVQILVKPGGQRGSEFEPKPGKIFCYPSEEELANSPYEAVLFYELHPNFWRQGLMTEAIKAVIPFVFTTLKLPRIIIDPVSSNEASLALAEKLGFPRIGEVDRKSVSFFKHSRQIRYELTREQWLKTKKPSKSKAKKKRRKGAATEAAGEAEGQDEPEAERKETEVETKDGVNEGQEDVPKGESDAADIGVMGTQQTGEDAATTNGDEVVPVEARTCRWCQVPSHHGVLECGGCKWAFWCSQPCKTAELTYHNGAHYLQCPGKGGKVDAHWCRMRAEFKKRPRRLGYS
ncbi:hypothetical protein RTBOTA2_002534 [Rhodotorula toruloides]|nr:hypothetical protein RTBOTA2_002534 [Rhodotorula toruloides]